MNITSHKVKNSHELCTESWTLKPPWLHLGRTAFQLLPLQLEEGQHDAHQFLYEEDSELEQSVNIYISIQTHIKQYSEINHQTCGKFLSDPFNLENALSQNTRISLFSELLVKSVAVKLSADLSQRFFEKQNMTTCIKFQRQKILNHKLIEKKGSSHCSLKRSDSLVY